MTPVTVIGAGLAGCECAWQLAGRGIPVRLIEMKPKKMTPSHVSENFAELVCSNSLRSDELTNAVGLLKEELRRLDSVVLASADHNRVAAGGALAVDREAFAREITERICAHPNITVERAEADAIPDGEVVIATGPLTSDAMAAEIQRLCPEFDLHFYDAVAPIVTLESVDMDSAFFASRYGKGTADYVNCPMDQAEYTAFIQELRTAKEALVHGFDDGAVFEGCMPVEVMARRGEDTLRYGPLKPVGLRDPRTGKDNYAVVQLRRDNAEGTLYNIVGFQTHLKWGEQKRLLSMIPGLENCNIVRYGVMHRNSYLCAPKVLRQTYQCVKRDDLFFAGQMCGVEGYVESAASGLIAGINMARLMQKKDPVVFPNTCIMGSMAYYITHASASYFQPMNANFGIVTLKEKVKKHERKEAICRQALEEIALIREML